MHIVGRVTDEIFSFLGPATRALQESGLAQTIVMIDAERYRHNLAQLDETANLVLVPRVRNPVTQWLCVLAAARVALGGGAPHAIHFHGFVPSLVGAWAARQTGVNVPTLYSPHASRTVGRLRVVGSLATRLLAPVVKLSRQAAIVNMPQEAVAFGDWQSVAVIESPISDEVFDVPRNEARHPLIVTGGRARGAQAAEVFAQLAVLLSGETLRLSFNWIGTVDPVSRARLNAANVGVFNVATDQELASRLAAGWIYVAPGSTRGFPVFLVEAMAAGLPCVVMTSKQYREVIRDGETGFLCRSEREMVECVARLIDDAELRARIGLQAQAETRKRFQAQDFNSKLLAAYAMPRMATAPQSEMTLQRRHVA